MPTPSPSYSLTLRVRIDRHPGAFATVAAAIGEAGGLLGAIDLVRASREATIRDITVLASGFEHGRQIVEGVRGLEGVEVEHVSDRTFLLHMGGKIEVTPKVPVRSRDDLSMVYTPGVARVCMAIHEAPSRAFALTIKRNTVAVVTDGTAVLGLGDIGPMAAMPVMEGKAMLFKEFAGVDAFPLALDTTDPEEIVAIVKAVAPGFGGINLEDIAAPRCFEIERRLREELQIPVFHDDQHGTAVVVLAAFLNALRIVGKRPEDVRVVVVGTGAAGVACTKILRGAGVGDIVGVDVGGIVHPGRDDLTPELREYAQQTNPRGLTGTVGDALEGADVMVGVSGPGAVSAEQVRTMAPGAVVFAMANPEPEVPPEEIWDDVAVIATGRSDYPNQINNVLAFPGIFRGALDVRATEINEEMKLAAGRAIAASVSEEELSPDLIVPSVFNRTVVENVAAAVAEAARATGVASRIEARGEAETQSF